MEVELFEQSNEEPHPEERALAVAAEAARRYQCPLTVVVPAKKHTNSTPIKYLLTEHEVKALLKGELIQIAENVIGRLESNATVKTQAHDQVLLVIRGWAEAIAKVRRVSNIRALIIVSPSVETTRQWKAAFSDERT